MISINRLVARKSDFRANDWMMDSGAFTEISTHGKYRTSVQDYAVLVDRWKSVGNLVAAVSQDYMCEEFILQKTGLSVLDHQRMTCERYSSLRSFTDAPLLPVLQGYEPMDYVRHLFMYGEQLFRGHWVGVGSICKRNGNPESIVHVLTAIKQHRPDLRLHGFGLKKTALENPAVRSLLYSSDSMAWCMEAWRDGGDANDPRGALRYCAKVQRITGVSAMVQPILDGFWG